MAKRKKNKKKKKPKSLPPAYDPEKYDWVNTKEGGYPRRKKGTYKPVTLNNVLQQNAKITRPTNEAAKRVMAKLYPFLQYLSTGRTVVRIAGGFKKSIAQNGHMDYSMLEELDFQDEYSFDDTANGLVTTKEDKGVLRLHIHVGNHCVKKHSGLATGYYLEAILLYGDPAEANTLRVDSVESRLYSFEEETRVIDCNLSLQLPEKECWMVLLKVSCLLDREIASTSKYHGMKVVKAGKGIS